MEDGDRVAFQINIKSFCYAAAYVLQGNLHWTLVEDAIVTPKACFLVLVQFEENLKLFQTPSIFFINVTPPPLFIFRL